MVIIRSTHVSVDQSSIAADLTREANEVDVAFLSAQLFGWKQSEVSVNFGIVIFVLWRSSKLLLDLLLEILFCRSELVDIHSQQNVYIDIVCVIIIKLVSF